MTKTVYIQQASIFLSVSGANMTSSLGATLLLVVAVATVQVSRAQDHDDWIITVSNRGDSLTLNCGECKFLENSGAQQIANAS